MHLITYEVRNSKRDLIGTLQTDRIQPHVRCGDRIRFVIPKQPKVLFDVAPSKAILETETLVLEYTEVQGLKAAPIPQLIVVAGRKSDLRRIGTLRRLRR